MFRFFIGLVLVMLLAGCRQGGTATAMNDDPRTNPVVEEPPEKLPVWYDGENPEMDLAERVVYQKLRRCITMKFSDAPLDDVLAQLEKDTGVKFESLVPVGEQIRLTGVFNNQPASEVLVTLSDHAGSSVVLFFGMNGKDLFVEYGDATGHNTTPVKCLYDAYRCLLRTSCFFDVAVSADGHEPVEFKAFRRICYSPYAREIFSDLLANATLPGRMYSLCGLYHADRNQYEKLKGEYAQRRLGFCKFSGCMSWVETLPEFIETGELDRHARSFLRVAQEKRAYPILLDSR